MMVAAILLQLQKRNVACCYIHSTPVHLSKQLQNNFEFVVTIQKPILEPF